MILHLLKKKSSSLPTLAPFYDQVYSNTRVPTQVNTSLTRVSTNQHESTLVRHESKTSQHESDTSQHESTQVKKCPR